MDVKVCLVVILLSVIATNNVFAAVSGTTCTADGNECDVITNAVCDTVPTKLVCKCKDGYTEDSNSKCQPDLNSPCIDGDTCSTGNAACVGDTGSKLCKCSSGFKDDGSGGCIPDKGLNDACTDTSECSGVNNAVCSDDSKCSCDTGYVPNEGACDQVLTDIVCTENGDCPGNAICNADKTCECDMDFTLQDNQCAGAASTKAMVWMMLSSLLIFLVDKLLM